MRKPKPARQFTEALRRLYRLEWNSWTAMHNRCSVPSTCQFARYGGRGLSVCERWRSFAAFVEDMGRKPSADHSLDRIDNSRGYQLENCRWATRSEQARNRSTTHMVEFRGKVLCLRDWATELGRGYDSVRSRHAKGLPLDYPLARTARSSLNKSDGLRDHKAAKSARSRSADVDRPSVAAALSATREAVARLRRKVGGRT